MNTKNSSIELKFASSIENVDLAFFEWLDLDMNLHCDTAEGFKKVNTIWVTPERAFQIKNNKEIRDINGTLNLPLVTVERTGITQDQKDAGTFYNNQPPTTNRHWVSKRINQKKTSEFANMQRQRVNGSINFVSPIKNEKVIYKFSSMMLPTYTNITYSINFFTQFQHQMNQLIQPFLTKSGSQRYFMIEKNGYKYECFIERNIDSKNNINSMEEEERRYVSTITIKVLAALLSDGDNEQDTLIKEYENAVEIKFPKDEQIVAQQNTIPVISAAKHQLIKKISFVFGDSKNSSYIFRHNFNTKNLLVIVKENFGDFRNLNPLVEFINEDQIQVTLDSVADVNRYSITIIG